jgi:CRISPR-associated protein (TIGR02584 family)
MPTVEKKEILVCVSGSTPQIITETLYVLVHERKRKISEIRVITTTQGRDEIVASLFDKGKFRQFLEDFQLPSESFVFHEGCIELLKGADQQPLPDIRTGIENALAADQICGFIRDLTKNPSVRIHATASGGRKTMGLYLMAAMQLYARHDDELSHVLVNKEFESNRNFFYPSPTPTSIDFEGRNGEVVTHSTADARIELADIPFIRLRHQKELGGKRYTEAVQATQSFLDFSESNYRLRIHLKKKGRSETISIGNRSISLKPRDFFLLVLCARFVKRGERVLVDDLSVGDFEDTFRAITRARGKERGKEDFQILSDFCRFLPDYVKHLDEDIGKLKTFFSQAKSRVNSALKEKGIPEQFHLSSVDEEERNVRSYGFELEPDQIEFVS